MADGATTGSPPPGDARSLSDWARLLRHRELSSVELTRACLQRADALDDRLGVFLARFDEQALAAAHRADAELARGIDRGPLQGIPLGLKDVLAAAEGPTTAQSLVLDPAWGAGRDAPVVTRLREAGAVIVGKLTTMEFAAGRPDGSKPFPIPRNPWDDACWAGGSSSGAGSGVATGMVVAAIGTDTGGSVRIPAAFCGVTGLKPTFGRVPKSGCVPLAFSLDHVGPLARSADDCASLLQVIAGPHPSDPHCADVPVPDYSAARTPRLDGLRVGVARVHEPVDESTVDAAERLEAALLVLRQLGARIREVHLPYQTETITAQMVTSASESLAYHRNDLVARSHDYVPGTVEYAAPGALVSGADYVQAQRVRRVAQAGLAEVFRDVDVIATPTASIGAPRLDELDARFHAIFSRIHTRYWSAVGAPVLAVPMGFTSTGLPLSLQLAGRPFDEATVLRAGMAYQDATDWHRRAPGIAGATVPATVDEG